MNNNNDPATTLPDTRTCRPPPLIGFDTGRSCCCWACAGCGETRPVPEDDPAGKTLRPPAAVSLQLNWFPEAEHGGFFSAEGPRALRRRRVGCGNSTRRSRGPGHPPGRHGAGPVRCDQRRPRAGRPRRRSQNGGGDGSNAGQPTVVMVHENSGIDSLENGGRSVPGRSSPATWSLFLQKKIDLSGVKLVPYAGNVTSSCSMTTSHNRVIRSASLLSLARNPFAPAS
ncbi:MAG: hypothetical protein Ct9H300mP1_23980 [Planctomycetaceae bacterium]|nr:MAG: hypothetical protein Ct9H300mP1_23980 [Planctomycetaceae bacterium]